MACKKDWLNDEKLWYGLLAMISASDRLRELTIVIPTYERQAYALRNMRFWSDKAASVIVLDGSEVPLKKEEQCDLGRNIRYFHVPISFNKRMELAIGMIETPFAILCADDEFQLPSGIGKCIEFLQENDDYAQCCGRALRFNVVGSVLKVEAVKLDHSSHLVSQKTPVERARYHIGQFLTTTVYAVHRTESLKHCLRYSMGYNFGNPYPQETLFELAAAAFGKSKVLSCVTWIRSSENEPVAAPGWLRKDVLSDWHDDPVNAQHVQAFYDAAIAAIENVTPSPDMEKIESEVVDIIEGRISRDRNMAKKKRITSPHWPSSSRASFFKWLFYIFKILGCQLLPNAAPILLTDYYLRSGRHAYKTLEKLSNFEILDRNELSSIWHIIMSFHGASNIWTKNYLVELDRPSR